MSDHSNFASGPNLAYQYGKEKNTILLLFSILRFKNQILCDLHFADMALMESSDFMQQLRNFKAQSLGMSVSKWVSKWEG